MSEIEIGRVYTVNSSEAYEELVEYVSHVVDEIRVEFEVDDESVRVHQFDLQKGEGTHQEVSYSTLEELLEGGYIEPKN